MYFQRLLRDFELYDGEGRTLLYIDNESTIKTARNGGGSNSRYLAIRDAWLWEAIHVHQVIKIDHINGHDNPSDAMTKNVIAIKVALFRSLNMGYGEIRTFEEYKQALACKAK